MAIKQKEISLKSNDVIKEHSAIYDKLEIPTLLRKHMARVAAVANLICDNWAGKRINKEDVIAAALLHDIGNVVKFDFAPATVKLFEQDSEHVDYLKALQKTLIEKYGTEDAHHVNLMMAKDIGANERIMKLLDADSADNTESILKSRDYEAMILLYSDQRVGPFGIISLKERYADFRKRYIGRIYKGMLLTEEKFAEMEKPAMKIETSLFKNIKISTDQINDEAVEAYLKKYKITSG